MFKLKNIDKKTIEVIILGVLIRAIFMVSSCHFDFISYYWFSHFLVYHKNIPANILQGVAGIVYLSPILQMHGLWLLLIKPFINGGVDFWPQIWFLNNNYFTVNIDTWVQFVRQRDIAWILFLLKVPYLLAEAAVILLIIKMAQGKELKRKLFNFLIFNPVSIFIIYIFGAGDIFYALCIVLSLYLIKQQRTYLGMFIFGLAIMKFYPLLLFPFFLIILSNKISERIKIAFFGLLPFIIAYCLSVMLGIPSPTLINVPHPGFIFSLALSFIHMQDKIFPFISFYCLLFIYLLYFSIPRVLFEDLSKYSLAALLIFYTFAFFHPQYFILIVPFIALQINKVRNITGMFAALTVCYFVYTFHWLNDLSWHLFLPLNPDFFVKLNSPHDFINRFMPADNFIGIFRSIFLAVALWIIYFIMDKRHADAGQLKSP